MKLHTRMELSKTLPKTPGKIPNNPLKNPTAILHMETWSSGAMVRLRGHEIPRTWTTRKPYSYEHTERNLARKHLSWPPPARNTNTWPPEKHTTGTCTAANNRNDPQHLHLYNRTYRENGITRTPPRITNKKEVGRDGITWELYRTVKNELSILYKS